MGSESFQILILIKTEERLKRKISCQEMSKLVSSLSYLLSPSCPCSKVDALSDNFEKDSGNWEVEVNPKGVLEKGDWGGGVSTKV
jgi:hypothetical protein